jgi:hypothetical protein
LSASSQGAPHTLPSAKSRRKGGLQPHRPDAPISPAATPHKGCRRWETRMRTSSRGRRWGHWSPWPRRVQTACRTVPRHMCALQPTPKRRPLRHSIGTTSLSLSLLASGGVRTVRSRHAQRLGAAGIRARPRIAMSPSFAFGRVRMGHSLRKTRSSPNSVPCARLPGTYPSPDSTFALLPCSPLVVGRANEHNPVTCVARS